MYLTLAVVGNLLQCLVFNFSISRFIEVKIGYMGGVQYPVWFQTSPDIVLCNYCFMYMRTESTDLELEVHIRQEEGM